MQLLNFDRHFRAHLVEWMARERACHRSEADMEEALPEEYARWLATPADFLAGETPGQYFEKFDDADALVAWMVEYHQQNVPVPDPLLDRIADLGSDAVAPLLDCAEEEGMEADLRVAALNLLKEIDTIDVIPACIRLIGLRTSVDPVADAAAELLITVGAACVPAILAALDDDEIDDDALATYLDVVCQFPGDPRINPYVLRAFLRHPDERAFYASLLAKLDDPNALPMLMEALDDPALSYADYLDVRNAIEALGGDVNEERSFDGDPAYEQLKHPK